MFNEDQTVVGEGEAVAVVLDHDLAVGGADDGEEGESPKHGGMSLAHRSSTRTDVHLKKGARLLVISVKLRD